MDLSLSELCNIASEKYGAHLLPSETNLGAEPYFYYGSNLIIFYF